LLSVTDIVVHYDDVPVLEKISIKVEENQIVSVAGGNGAGKTTLLKTISGYMHPLSGEITFLDVGISRLECSEIVNLGLVRVPEGRKVFPSLTVLENLELGSYSRRAKISRKDSLKKAYELFPILAARQKQAAGTLSGGEQQMLAIARGLMSLPKLLMLDEPSLGLAPIMVSNIFEIIKQIYKRGSTVMVVEQNIYSSLLLCHTGYVMENGKIVLAGSGKELLETEYIKKVYLGI
jgi:branched-chain amino acid transport system ATP-binding protein